MNNLLCVAEDCRAPGQHAGCTDERCPGCVPRMAADKVWLCLWHMEHLRVDAIEAARLHGELALVLAGGGGGGPRVSGGTVDKSLNLNVLAAEVRATIRATLVAWARLISEERGFALPENRITAIGAYVARDPEWLASREVDIARSAARELAELVQIARPVAYPGGTRRFRVAGCPECGGDLMAVLRREDSLVPQEVVCAENPEHRWDRLRWLALGAATVRPVADRVAVGSGTLGHGGWAGRRVA